MKVIFEGEGVFVGYEEKAVEIGNGKLIHRKPPWWKLKEAVR